jgi:hypothetical protein
MTSEQSDIGWLSKTDSIVYQVVFTLFYYKPFKYFIIQFFCNKLYLFTPIVLNKKNNNVLLLSLSRRHALPTAAKGTAMSDAHADATTYCA